MTSGARRRRGGPRGHPPRRRRRGRAASGLATLLLAASACTSGAQEADAGFGLERVEVPVGGPSGALVASDVDDDGDLDLVVAAGGRLVVLANDGAGVFEVSARIEVGDYPVDFALGSLDGDPWPDLAIANHETNYVTVLFGVEGGFAPRGDPRIQVDVDPHPHGVGLGDLDGDGHVDLLVDDRGRESVRLFRGRGDGTFHEPVLVAVGGDPYRGFVVADLDGDGRTDLVTPNPDRVAVWRAPGSDPPGGATQLDPGFAPFSVTTGDYDGDGVTDVAAGSGEGAGAAAVWSGRPDGTFGPPRRHDVGEGPTKVASADLDGDGRDEVLVASYVGAEVAVIVGGDEPAVRRLSLSGWPYGFAAGDLDGDGRVDFAVANDGEDHITLFFNRSFGG